MQIRNIKPQNENQLQITSQQNPARFLLKLLINTAWIFFGFKCFYVTFANPANADLAYFSPFLAIIGPAVYCMYQNWNKFYTCVQVYDQGLVLYYGEKGSTSLGYYQLKALILKKKSIELLTSSESFKMPIYCDYKKVVQAIEKNVQKHTGRKLPVVDETHIKGAGA